MAAEGRVRDAALAGRVAVVERKRACDEAPSAPLTRHWGTTLIRDPNSVSRRLGPSPRVMLARGTRNGHRRRAARGTSRGDRRRGARRGRPCERGNRRDRLRGRARNRQDADAGRARGARRRPGPTCCAAEPRSSRPICPLGLVDALDEYVAGLDPRKLESLDDGVRAELGQLLPSLSDMRARGSRRAQDQRYRVHRAVRELLERIAATKPWCSCSTTSTGRTRPPSSCSAPSCGDRPPRACCSRWPRGRARCRPACQARSTARPGRLAGAPRAPRARARGRRRTAGRAPWTGRWPTPSTSRAAATRSTSSSSRAPRARHQPEARGHDLALAGVEVPAAVASALTEELALLGEPARRLLDGAAVAGDPFEPELAAAPQRPRTRGRRGARRAPELPTSSDRTEVPAASASATRGAAVVYETAPAAGSWTRTLAVPTPSPNTAPRPPARAHHVEHSARPRGQGRDRSCCARPVRRRDSCARRRRPLVRCHAPPAPRHRAAGGAASACWPAPRPAG